MKLGLCLFLLSFLSSLDVIFACSSAGNDGSERGADGAAVALGGREEGRKEGRLDSVGKIFLEL